MEDELRVVPNTGNVDRDQVLAHLVFKTMYKVKLEDGKNVIFKKL